ncbi:MAG TPA: hypothetical protein VJ867_15850 [Gemmatimonadaceae bacterium]|nr:hypothetical protein [Gemmatimonadaceae bacterium]
MSNEKADRSYLDENLSEREKDSGRTRFPLPEEEGHGGRDGVKNGETLNPDRPDEFGDGDRRS